MNLNKTCTKFFQDKWGDPAIKLHSQCVIDCCLSLTKDTDLDSDVFIIAGWIHDLGRKTDVSQHHKLSLEYLDIFLQEYPVFAKKKDLIMDCILNHRKDGSPQSIYGIVFKASDKIALYHKKWLKSKLLFS
jgi:HD superfamily phosphodiesterase